MKMIKETIIISLCVFAITILAGVFIYWNINLSQWSIEDRYGVMTVTVLGTFVVVAIRRIKS